MTHEEKIQKIQNLESEIKELNKCTQCNHSRDIHPPNILGCLELISGTRNNPTRCGCRRTNKDCLEDI